MGRARKSTPIRAEARQTQVRLTDYTIIARRRCLRAPNRSPLSVPPRGFLPFGTDRDGIAKPLAVNNLRQTRLTGRIPPAWEDWHTSPATSLHALVGTGINGASLRAPGSTGFSRPRCAVLLATDGCHRAGGTAGRACRGRFIPVGMLVGRAERSEVRRRTHCPRRCRPRPCRAAVGVLRRPPRLPAACR